MIGQRIARYEVLELLGEGGKGLVCKARTVNLEGFDTPDMRDASDLLSSLS